MAETPMAGDVWRTNSGLIVFVTYFFGSLRLMTAEGQSAVLNADETLDDGATLLVRDGKPYQPPSPPAAPGDVIAVECAVMLTEFGNVDVNGEQRFTAEEVASGSGYKHIATVTVNVPRSLLSPAVLPDVSVSK